MRARDRAESREQSRRFRLPSPESPDVRLCCVHERQTDRLEGGTSPIQRGSGRKRRRKVRSPYCGQNANVSLEFKDECGDAGRRSRAFPSLPCLVEVTPISHEHFTAAKKSAHSCVRDPPLLPPFFPSLLRQPQSHFPRQTAVCRFALHFSLSLSLSICKKTLFRLH